MERDRIAEFFSEYGNPETVVYFMLVMIR
ncbi:MAG: hypothetical protein ACR5LD_07550 [Symbiopectobacterium sp.]